MAATKWLSDLSCMAPDLPGLMNSRVTSTTLGGPCMSCAAAYRLPPAARVSANRAGCMIFIFCESSLTSSEFHCDGEGMRNGKRNLSKGIDYESVCRADQGSFF